MKLVIVLYLSPTKFIEIFINFYRELFHRQDIRFILIGGLATCMHFVVYSLLCSFLGFEPLRANILGYLAAVSISFFGNAYWSFRVGASKVRALRFIVVSLAGFSCNAFFVHIVTTTLHLSPNWAAIAIVGITPWFSYVLSSKWAFHPDLGITKQKALDCWYRPIWKLMLAFVFLDLFFFRHNYLSGGDLIFGDLGDPRIVLVLLEHWEHWWRGEAQWNSPSFFWPQEGALGYTDAYFVFAIPHIFLRSIGFDPYLSMEGAFHTMKFVGFCGMTWLLSSRFRVSQNWAIAGGGLFFILNSLYWHSIHMQLASVAITPWVLGLALKWITEGQRKSTSIMLGVLFSAFFLTSFYMAWFSALSVILLIIITLLTKNFHPEKGWQYRLLLGAAAFVVGMLPFLYLYLPVLIEKQGHDFTAVIFNALYPLEFIRVGPNNLLWGWLENFLFKPLYPEIEGDYNYISDYERMSGFTPVLAVGFLIFSIIFIKNWSRHIRTNNGPGCLAAYFSVLGLVFWLISVRYGDFTPWKLVYELVPGGSAMRVPSRILLFVSVFVIPVVILGLVSYFRNIGKSRVAIMIITIMFAEQINTAPLQQISRSKEKVRLSFSPPPSECEAFYISRGDSSFTGYSLLDGFYIPNIDAMVLASMWEVPTLNGISTWFPEGWALQHPGNNHYQKSAHKWARQNSILHSHICSLDMNKREWKTPALLVPIAPKLDANGLSIYESEAEGILIGGWSDTEDWGSWSGSDHVTIQFFPTQENAGFSLKMHAYRAEDRPIKLTVSIKGRDEVWQTEIISSKTDWYSFKSISSLDGPTQIDISIDSPRRPSEWGEPDQRKLAIGLSKIKLIQPENI
ncbi:MAG: GtrA family protein [Neptuniibacter sp.]